MLLLIDIDECKTGTHKCNQFGECSNTNGSHECICKAGYFKIGLFNCTGKLSVAIIVMAILHLFVMLLVSSEVF